MSSTRSCIKYHSHFSKFGNHYKPHSNDDQNSNGLSNQEPLKQQQSIFQAFEQHSNQSVVTLKLSKDLPSKTTLFDGVFGTFKRIYKTLIGIVAASVILVLSAGYLYVKRTRPGVAKILKAFHTSTADWKKMLNECSDQDISKMSPEVCRRSNSYFFGFLKSSAKYAKATAIYQNGKTKITVNGNQIRFSTLVHELLHAFQFQHKAINPFYSSFNLGFSASCKATNLFSRTVHEKAKVLAKNHKRHLIVKNIPEDLYKSGLNEFMQKQSTIVLKYLKLRYLTEILTHGNILKMATRLKLSNHDYLNEQCHLEVYKTLNIAIRRELRRRRA